jgi:hypothetical protein
MSNLPELWLPVIGYEGLYEVSDAGRVRSLGRMIRHSRRGRRFQCGRILSPGSGAGYPSIQLCKNGTQFRVSIHQLVAAAFIGKCPDGHQVNHRNGIKTDNAASNLEYVTPKQNKLHAKLMMGCSLGQRNGSAKLDPDKVREARRLSKQSVSQSKIAERFGVTQGAIGNMLRGETWAHVQ